MKIGMANLIHISNPSSSTKGEVRPQNAKTASKVAWKPQNRQEIRQADNALIVCHQFHHPKITRFFEASKCRVFWS